MRAVLGGGGGVSMMGRAGGWEINKWGGDVKGGFPLSIMKGGKPPFDALKWSKVYSIFN